MTRLYSLYYIEIPKRPLLLEEVFRDIIRPLPVGAFASSTYVNGASWLIGCACISDRILTDSKFYYELPD